MPTLVLDDGQALAESNAILWYFGEGTPFVPDDRLDRARVLQWMFFEQYDHEPAIAVARFLRSYSGRPEAYEDRRDELLPRGRRALEAMDRHLAGRDWLVGERMTIADVCLYAYTHAPGKAVSTSSPTPRCGRGSIAWPPSPGTSRSTPDLPAYAGSSRHARRGAARSSRARRAR